MNFHITFVVILFAYLLVTALYLLRLVFNRPRIAAVALRLCLFTLLVQGVTLFLHFFGGTHSPFSGYFDYYQTSAWLLACLFVGLCFAKKFYGAGPLFMLAIDVFCILSLTHENPYSFTTSLPGYGFLFFHLSSIFLSLVFFIVSFVSAILFLISEHQIKKKISVGWVARLPSLHEMEFVQYRSMTLGFALFTLSILTGAGFAKINTGHYLSSDSKQVVSLLIWFFFCIFLNWRVQQGWRGHKGVVLSLFGFAGLILLSFLGL